MTAIEPEVDTGGENVPLLPDDPSPPPEPTMPDVPVDPPDPQEAAVRQAKSNRQIDYACTECHRVVGKDNLKVKRVQYKEMGVHGRIEKSRVVAWLCMTPQPDGQPSCLDADGAWGTPRLSGSPGMADTKLARGET